MSVKLELENVGYFRGRKEFKFEKGLNIIYAPNASGKTSILAGLRTVMVSALTRAELARALNDYEERGEVRLFLDGKEYAVELLRRPDRSVEALGKKLVDDGAIKTVSYVDLENKLVSAVYSGKEDEVVKIVREVTGVAYIENIMVVLSSLESSYGHRYEVKREGYERAKKEVQDQIKEVEERLRGIRNKIIEIQRDPSIEPVRKEIEEIEAKRREINRELSEKRIKETEISNKLGLIDRDYGALEARLKVLSEDREKLEDERKLIQEKLSEVRVAIEKLESEVRSLSTERDTVRSELRELEIVLRRRREILSYATCPYCGSEIRKERILEEIQSIEDSVYELNDKLREIEDAIEKRKREIARLKESTEERLQAVTREIAELDYQIKDLERKIGSLKDQKEKLGRELETIKREVVLLEREIRVLMGRLERLSEKVPIVKELRKLEEEEGYLSKRLDYLYGRMRQLDALYEEVKVLEDRLETIRLLKEYFEERYNELSVVIVNRINEEVLKHFKLLKLAELEYPIMKKDFTLRLVRTGGSPSSLTELSDAEKAIFTILLTLALKECVAPDYLFYILDGIVELIDETRLKAILKYLREKADKRLVIIVTKNRPFAEEIREIQQEDIYINSIPALG